VATAPFAWEASVGESGGGLTDTVGHRAAVATVEPGIGAPGSQVWTVGAGTLDKGNALSPGLEAPTLVATAPFAWEASVGESGGGLTDTVATAEPGIGAPGSQVWTVGAGVLDKGNALPPSGLPSTGSPTPWALSGAAAGAGAAAPFAGATTSGAPGASAGACAAGSPATGEVKDMVASPDWSQPVRSMGKRSASWVHCVGGR